MTDMLTSEEIRKVIEATIRGHRDAGGATEEQITAAVQWAHQAKVDATLLEMTVAGDLYVNMDSGADNPTFELSEQGRRRSE